MQFESELKLCFVLEKALSRVWFKDPISDRLKSELCFTLMIFVIGRQHMVCAFSEEDEASQNYHRQG